MMRARGKELDLLRAGRPGGLEHAGRWRRLQVLLVFLILFLGQALYAQAAAPWPTAQWPVSTPAAQGIDPRAVLALHEELAKPVYEVDSVLLIRNGFLISEANFVPFDGRFVHDLRSVTKSITGTVLGVALQQGKIGSLNDSVLSYFPERPARDPRQAALRLTHLLDMRSGMRWREAPYDATSDLMRMASSANWLDYILERPMERAPGERFHYSGAAPHLLSAVLSRATGQDAHAYARRHLFGPLGISESVWRKDPQGIANGESGLSLRPRDLAKIGLLYLRNGMWEQRRLLPAAFVQRVLAGAQPHQAAVGQLPSRYGSLWWSDPAGPALMASGRHGQHLVMLPRHDLILVINAKTPETQPVRIDVRELLQKVLVPGLARGPLAGSTEAATKLLNERLLALTREVPLAGVAAPALATRISNRSYAMTSNRMGLATLSVTAVSDRVAVLRTTWRTAAAPGGVLQIDLPFGSDGRYVMSAPTPLGVYASRGAWRDGATLLVESEVPANSVDTLFALAFDSSGQRVELKMTDGDGLDETISGRAQ